jgi:hypothetical protein
MATAPLIVAAFAASIVTCFAPKQNCAGRATNAINAARHEILVNAYASPRLRHPRGSDHSAPDLTHTRPTVRWHIMDLLLRTKQTTPKGTSSRQSRGKNSGSMLGKPITCSRYTRRRFAAIDVETVASNGPA